NSPIFFFSPHRPHGYLSQWYPSLFTPPSSPHTYTTAEQYMMHRKSLLFSPPSSTIPAQILATDDPRELKRLGRMVEGFDKEVWEREREGVVEEGNWWKFKADKELGRRLLETGGMELVEAAARDRVWGVGFGVERAPFERKRWGMNLLGKALMRVRERLRREMEES
ncbi:DUF1768-domain-containing protein, partial [Ascodesmis nigricans]